MPCKILVVDDEAPVRDLMCDLLKKEKYEIKSASSGEEAVVLVEKENFDIVLLDIRLGGMSGFETLIKIKDINPKLIVVMITGFGFDDELIAESKRYGSSGYISKSMPASEVMGILKMYIEMAQDKD